MKIKQIHESLVGAMVLVQRVQTEVNRPSNHWMGLDDEIEACLIAAETIIKTADQLISRTE